MSVCAGIFSDRAGGSLPLRGYVLAIETCHDTSLLAVRIRRYPLCIAAVCGALRDEVRQYFRGFGDQAAIRV